jgi:hypothetical protein
MEPNPIPQRAVYSCSYLEPAERHHGIFNFISCFNTIVGKGVYYAVTLAIIIRDQCRICEGDVLPLIGLGRRFVAPPKARRYPGVNLSRKAPVQVP